MQCLWKIMLLLLPYRRYNHICIYENIWNFPRQNPISWSRDVACLQTMNDIGLHLMHPEGALTEVILLSKMAVVKLCALFTARVTGKSVWRCWKSLSSIDCKSKSTRGLTSCHLSWLRKQSRTNGTTEIGPNENRHLVEWLQRVICVAFSDLITVWRHWPLHESQTNWHIIRAQWGYAERCV